jgi:UDP-N-acetylmuramoylalanine--D-glutamate ligase
MIVPEHLDYHADEAEYIDAKRNILRFQRPEDFAVINRDYIASNESDVYTEGKVYQVTRERTTTEEGCFIKDGGVWIRMQGPVSSRSALEGVQGTEWKVIDIEDIFLPGKHNLENISAAAMAATLAGATKSEIVDVLKSFKGLEHRLEFVKEVHGVKYYDDSFSTTPETSIAAIETFTEPEILILGGSGKKSDFSELGKVISEAKNIKAIIGIGEEWPRIREQIAKGNEARIVIEGAKDMETVVQAASKIAQPGDVVLLSPACASFGMFKNYKERGEQFRVAVKQLSA